MTKAITEYYDALERLKKDKPIIVKRGTKIGNDTVALEAGRSRGSIKKSRHEHTDLIKDIAKAAEQENKPKKENNLRIEKLTSERNYYKEEYHKSVGRELMLIDRLAELEKEIKEKEYIPKTVQIIDLKYGQRNK